MFSHYATRKISPICKISTFSDDLSFLNPRIHLNLCLTLCVLWSSKMHIDKSFIISSHLYAYIKKLHGTFKMILLKLTNVFEIHVHFNLIILTLGLFFGYLWLSL